MDARRRHHGQRGQSVVEMALLLPILCLVLFAIIDYGRFFHLKSMAASVAAEAVRQASLPGATDAAISALVTGKLNNAADASPPGFNLGVSPTVTISPSTRVAGGNVTVALSYPYVPLILPRYMGITLFPADITAGASAVVEP